ncbi:MAG: 3-phosphoserine/phosphohydroxythreonine transaminase [Spirosomataceae bacterium]
MKKHNFNPGPAIIPPSVLEEAAENLKEYQHLGISIAEMSHRAPAFLAIIEEATALIKELYGLTDAFEVLWVPGGASSQLAIAPMNLVSPRQSIALVDTGYWATKAIKAASQLCKVEVLDSSQATHYDHIPKDWQLPRRVQYLHVVSNETINGTQYHQYPDVSVPLVADMTSDFLSRPLPLEKFGLIFASAQKNFGMAGVTCVVLRKELIEQRKARQIPTIFDYKTHIESQSLYHTCPTFPIYVSMLTLRWTKQQGGLTEMQRRNQEKAQLLYNEVDRNPYFMGNVVTEDRSVMNVCFKGVSPEVETAFLAFAEKNDVVGIKGFPTVGGFRASIYNAMPIESVQVLVDLMKAFNP